MLWGCFSALGVGPLIEVEGIMDRFKYADIVTDTMLPYARRNLGRCWMFRQDNDPKHCSKHVEGSMKRHKIRKLEWPSQSPDLNPIENLWAILDKRVRVRQASNTRDFLKMLQETWQEIPQETLIRLVASMPKRCAKVIKGNGWHTNY